MTPRPPAAPCRASAPAALALALAATLASAAITLETKVDFREEAPGRAAFSGSFANAGDQTAEHVVLRLETPFGDILESPLGHIDPRASRPWALAVDHPPAARRGEFAAVLRLHYQDSNGFALFIATVFPYRLGEPSAEPAPARIALEAPMRDIEGTGLAGVAPLREPVPLDGAATLSLTVRPAPEAAGRPASLRIVLPDSLAVAGPPPVLDALPAGPVAIPVAITNLAALAGSRIPVAAILETADPDGTRRCDIAQILVPVGTTPADFRRLVAPPRTHERDARAAAFALLALFLAWEVRSRASPGRPPRDRSVSPAPEWIALLAAWALLAWQVRLGLVFADTLCLGGDLPAHHYLFSHLRESLAHGRIVSWAPGWWCGFPMYQYYFPLPYLAMCALDLALPANVAFKLALVLGIFLTPLCTLAAARLLRLPRPAPALLVLATVPLLCDTTHTMWGVNLASTFAGMISNSWSFAFFPLAIASAAADMRDARPRARTALLFLAVLLSHFFTSIVLALLLVAAFAALCARAAARRGSWRQPLALVPTGLAATLLMAWWLLPLVATRPWSVDYGSPWDIRLFGNLPVAAKLAIPLALAAAGVAWLRRRRRRTPDASASPARTATALALLQAAVAVALFLWGYGVSKVFVNCRLWPFWVHALLSLGALGAASLLRDARHPRAGLAAAAALVFAFAWDVPNLNRAYALWDFQGIEALPDAPVFFDVAERLRGTPGRFACDMHPGNERLGSSRAFESLPAVCGKPIVEGGILNSALGSLVAYSVQGEMSDAPAGWPLRVIPKSLDTATGTRHLALLGARHFLARSSFVQQALEDSGQWSLLHDYGRWRLYENPAVDGSLVHAYPAGLPTRETDDPQGAIVDWARDPALADTPVVLRRPGDDAAFPSPASPTPAAPAAVPCPAELSFNRLRFSTGHVGAPHLVAVSYFPNWRPVRGADRVELAAPGLMVVVPTAPDVELAFAPTRADLAGRWLLLPGALLLAALLLRRGRR